MQKFCVFLCSCSLQNKTPWWKVLGGIKNELQTITRQEYLVSLGLCSVGDVNMSPGRLDFVGMRFISIHFVCIFVSIVWSWPDVLYSCDTFADFWKFNRRVTDLCLLSFLIRILTTTLFSTFLPQKFNLLHTPLLTFPLSLSPPPAFLLCHAILICLLFSCHPPSLSLPTFSAALFFPNYKALSAGLSVLH